MTPATCDKTAVNGIEFHNWSYIDSSNARTFAAALPRGGAEAIKRVETGVGGVIDLWLDASPEGSWVEIPDGYRVESVHAINGSVCLNVVPEGER